MNKVTLYLEEMEYAIEEELKTLRTNLLFCGSDKKVIMVTSTAPSEGKSETSLNLSISLAKLNKRVLLMDLDLRKSVMISRCDATEAKYGMSHFLSGQCQLTDVICTTNVPKMHIALAGPTSPNPTELLASDLFKKTIRSLREVYDYIIVDTAPLGLVIDGAIVAKECDGSLLVVESGRIKYREAQRVKQQLESSGCSILGAVLNKVPQKFRKYYYHKYSKYGRYENYGGYYGHGEESKKKEKKGLFKKKNK